VLYNAFAAIPKHIHDPLCAFIVTDQEVPEVSPPVVFLKTFVVPEGETI